MYIHNTSMEDSGVYICIARNDAGTAFGQIRLRMQGKVIHKQAQFACRIFVFSITRTLWHKFLLNPTECTIK